MKTLLIGKNSFLSKNLKLKSIKKISYKDIQEYNLRNFDKLILMSFPPKYKVQKEREFLFEKKILDHFLDKEIIYFSTQKVYPYKLNCTEKEKLNPDSYYGENKLKIEKIISDFSSKAKIFRVSSVFSKNDFAKDSFFFHLQKNWIKKKEINFDISLKSIRDFIPLSYLYLIIEKIRDCDDFGIFNIGSKNGISISQILDMIFKKKIKIPNKNLISQIKSRTLNNDKICKLLNLNPSKIHNDTKKEISKLTL